MNSNKFFVYTVGLIFLIAGLGTILEMLSIPFSSIILLLIGAAFLCCYYKFNNNVFKYLSCFFIPTGISYLIISAFNVVGGANFLLIYFALACAFLLLYLTSKRKLFIYISVAIAFFALHVFTAATSSMSELLIGYDCFYIGILAVIVFIFENKNLGYFPIWISIIAYLCGILNFLSFYNIIAPVIFKLSVSLVLLLTGASIILFNFLKSRNHQKEN